MRSLKIIIFVSILFCISSHLTAQTKANNQTHKAFIEYLEKNIHILKPEDLRNLDSLKKIARLSGDEKSELDYIYIEAQYFKNHKRYNIMRILVNQGLVVSKKLKSDEMIENFTYLNAYILQYDGEIVKENQIWKVLISNAKGNCVKLAKYYNSLANSYIVRQEFEKSTEAYNKAVECLIKTKSYASLANIQTNIAVNYFFQNKIDSAFMKFHEALYYNLKSKDNEGIITNLLNLSEALLFDKQYDSTLFYLNKSNLYGEKNNFQKLQYFTIKQDYFRDLKNIDSAYIYIQRRDSLKAHINDEDNILLNTEFEFLYKTRENEINQTNIEKEYQIKKIKAQRIYYIFVFSGLVLLIIVLALFYAYIVQKRNNAKLKIQNDEIEAKNAVIDHSLKEKEILLKEIHHRVKNNLQIISSLLNLQSKTITDEKAVAAINEGRERIFAISLIHQKLYQERNFATLDFKDYLQDLIHNLKVTHGQDNDQFLYEIDAQNSILNIDTAVPLGLILCELVSNSFKHAFPNQEKAKISVKLFKIEEKYHLEYVDNGIGLPNNSEFPVIGSLGAEIITTLIEQLEGTFEILKNDEGFGIGIIFEEI